MSASIIGRPVRHQPLPCTSCVASKTVHSVVCFSIASSQSNINVCIKSGIHTWQDPGISFMSCSHQPPKQPTLPILNHIWQSCPLQHRAAHLPNQRVVSHLAPTLNLISYLALTATFIYFISGIYQCPLCRSTTGPPHLYHFGYPQLLILPTISQTVVSTT